MIEGKICLLLPEFMPQLRSTPEPRTFKKAHVNDFSKLGDAGSWEDHDWSEWTSSVEATQVTPACFMHERNMDPSSNNDQYLVLTQEEEAKEGGDEVISYWSEDDGNWFFDEVGKIFPNEGEVLHDITEAIRIWGPLMDEDWSAELKTLFQEKDKNGGNEP